MSKRLYSEAQIKELKANKYVMNCTEKSIQFTDEFRKIAMEFQTYAEKTSEYPHDYGEMRRLRVELQKLCGITELEALNVLINRNVSDYIWKYNRATSSELCSIGRKNISIPEHMELLEYTDALVCKVKGTA